MPVIEFQLACVYNQWSFCSYLTLVIDLLGDLPCENLGRISSLQNLVLTERKKALQDELPQGEAHKHVLPWEEWPIEKARQLLNVSG
jgi:hypothetical protein